MLKAFEFGSSCIQVPITGNDTTSSDWNVGEDFSEDCLYLNIWAPHPRREKRAVMVGVNQKSSFFSSIGPIGKKCVKNNFKYFHTCCLNIIPKEEIYVIEYPIDGR